MDAEQGQYLVEGGKVDPRGFGAAESLVWVVLDAFAKAVAHLLFAIRFKLGAWFGWDEETLSLPIPGCSEHSLSERLPSELLGREEPPLLSNGFKRVFRTDTEWAAEISNSTVHAILHLGWVLGEDGRYRGQLGVYVKNRGRFGRTYMTAIAPFRHWIVYPALMRRIDHDWRNRAGV